MRWRPTGERFACASDGHWNRRGHAMAAGAIAEFLSAVRLAARLR